MDDATDYALPVDPQRPIAPVRIVNRLEVEEFAPGLHRVFVELVGDGLASGVRVPVLVAKGRRDGPVFGLTAAVHGNELNGIPVIHELFEGLDVDALYGTLVGVVAVNVPGLHVNERRFIDGADLNRIMPGKPAGSVAEVYAYRLLHRIVDQFEFLVDLHTASFGRVNSLYVRADLTDPRTAAMADLQHPQIIVHNAADDATLRGAAMQMGIPAITVEIGDPQRWQRSYTAHALEGVRRVLHWAGLLESQTQARTAEPLICKSSMWMFTDRGGLLRVFPALASEVQEGQRVATIKNAFGDPIRGYRAPFDGIVIGKSANPVGYTGARILHLGRVASAEDFPALAQLAPAQP